MLVGKEINVKKRETGKAFSEIMLNKEWNSKK